MFFLMNAGWGYLKPPHTHLLVSTYGKYFRVFDVKMNKCPSHIAYEPYTCHTLFYSRLKQTYGMTPIFFIQEDKHLPLITNIITNMSSKSYKEKDFWLWNEIVFNWVEMCLISQEKWVQRSESLLVPFRVDLRPTRLQHWVILLGKNKNLFTRSFTLQCGCMIS